MKKNKILVFIIILTLLGNIVLITNTASSQTSEYPDDYLVLQLIKTDPIPLQTSEYADVWLKVSNRGNNKLENISIRYEPQYPFSTDPDEKTEWNLGTMHPMEEYRVHLQVKVDENAVHGENFLRIYTNHKDSSGEDLRKIPIQIRTDDAALAIQKIEFPKYVRPGSTNQMNMTLRNLGDSHLKNIDVYLDPSSEELPFSISNNRRRIQKISPQKTEEISYTVKTDQNASNGVYKPPIDIKFENEAGVNFEINQITEVTIGGKPNLKLNLESKILKPNQKNDIKLEIINNGQGKAKFVSVNVLKSEKYQILTNNLKYLEKINPGKKENFNLTIFTEKNYENLKIPVEITYNDPAKGIIKETQELSAKIYDEEYLEKYGLTNKPELDLTLTDNDLREAGKTGNITLRTVNKGEGEAKFVTLEIPESQNYKLLSANNTYYGNLKPEDHQTSELKLYAEEAQSLTIPANLVYQNENGEKLIKTQNITVKLFNEEQIKKYNLNNDEFNTILIIIIIIIAFIGIIAAIPILNKYLR